MSAPTPLWGDTDDVYGNRFITAGGGSVLSLYGEPGDSVIHMSQIKPPWGDFFPKHVALDKVAGTMSFHDG